MVPEASSAWACNWRLNSRSARRSRLLISSGVMIIEVTMATSNICTQAGSSKRLASTSEKTTSENSPTCESVMAVFSAVRRSPAKLKSVNTSAAFTSIKSGTSNAICSRLAITTSTLICSPTETKNTPSSRFLNGIRSASTWYL